MKVMVLKSVDADELWNKVFGSAYELMDWWTGIDYKSKTDWDKAGEVVLYAWSATDPDTEISKVITIKEIVNAYSALVAKGYTHCNGHTLDSADACTGDAILQTAMYGEIVYG